MKLDIITIENQEDKVGSALKNEAEEVSFPLKDEDRQLIASMREMLYETQGVGLAAPQVDVRKKIALIYIPESAALLRDNVKPVDMHVLINAKYKPSENTEMFSDFEGCYSVNSVYGKVPRYYSIELEYQDESGTKIQKTVEGFYARVLQHEIDHLNGKLITDRLTPDCLQGSFEEMLAIRRQELSPEKRELFDELVKKKGMGSKEE